MFKIYLKIIFLCVHIEFKKSTKIHLYNKLDKNAFCENGILFVILWNKLFVESLYNTIYENNFIYNNKYKFLYLIKFTFIQNYFVYHILFVVYFIKSFRMGIKSNNALHFMKLDVFQHIKFLLFFIILHNHICIIEYQI